jgi:hypothetical protein
VSDTLLISTFLVPTGRFFLHATMTIDHSMGYAATIVHVSQWHVAPDGARSSVTTDTWTVSKSERDVLAAAVEIAHEHVQTLRRRWEEP